MWERKYSRHREEQAQIPCCFRENKPSGQINIHLMNNVTLYFLKSIANLIIKKKNKIPDFLHEVFMKPLWLHDVLQMGWFWLVR